MPREWDNFEVKETTSAGIPHPPAEPTKYPWDSRAVFGICYRSRLDAMPSAEDAYQMALGAHYYEWDKRTKAWIDVGGPEGLLRRIVELTRLEGYKDWAVSWPEPWPAHYVFGNPEEYQIEPYRELFRRHLDLSAYIADRDFMIEKTYRRPRVSEVVL